MDDEAKRIEGKVKTAINKVPAFNPEEYKKILAAYGPGGAVEKNSEEVVKKWDSLTKTLGGLGSLFESWESASKGKGLEDLNWSDANFSWVDEGPFYENIAYYLMASHRSGVDAGVFSWRKPTHKNMIHLNRPASSGPQVVKGGKRDKLKPIETRWKTEAGRDYLAEKIDDLIDIDKQDTIRKKLWIHNYRIDESEVINGIWTSDEAGRLEINEVQGSLSLNGDSPEKMALRKRVYNESLDRENFEKGLYVPSKFVKNIENSLENSGVVDGKGELYLAKTRERLTTEKATLDFNEKLNILSRFISPPQFVEDSISKIASEAYIKERENPSDSDVEKQKAPEPEYKLTETQLKEKKLSVEKQANDPYTKEFPEVPKTPWAFEDYGKSSESPYRLRRNKSIWMLLNSGSDFMKNKFDVMMIVSSSQDSAIKNLFNVFYSNQGVFAEYNEKKIMGDQAAFMIRTSTVSVPMMQSDNFNLKFLYDAVSKVKSKVKFERKSEITMRLDEPLFFTTFFGFLSNNNMVTPEFGKSPAMFAPFTTNRIVTESLINKMISIDLIVKHSCLMHNTITKDHTSFEWVNPSNSLPFWFFQDVNFLGNATGIQFDRDNANTSEITFPFLFKRLIKIDLQTRGDKRTLDPYNPENINDDNIFRNQNDQKWYFN